jgi:hypothetical protein
MRRRRARAATGALVASLAAAVVAFALLRGADSEGRGVAGLSTSGTKIVDARGHEVRLRGFNVLPVWSDRPGSTWGAGHYRRIRAAGFNAVRFMLHWHVMEPDRRRLDRRNLRTLDAAVGRARAAGLAIILNPIGLFQGDLFVPLWARTGDALAAVESAGSWYVRALADRYSNDRAVAAIDPVNEPPTYPPDQNRVLRMYRTLIDAVRQVAPSRLVLFEPSFGDSSMAGADLGLLGPTKNLVFSMHDYYAGGAGNGYAPTGELVGKDDGARYSIDGASYDPASAPELEAHLLVNLQIMRAAGIPTWIGEFGMTPDTPEGRRWIRDKVALYDRHGVGYAWWLYDLKGSFAPLDPGTHRLRPFTRLFTRPGAR